MAKYISGFEKFLKQVFTPPGLDPILNAFRVTLKLLTKSYSAYVSPRLRRQIDKMETRKPDVSTQYPNGYIFVFCLLLSPRKKQTERAVLSIRLDQCLTFCTECSASRNTHEKARVYVQHQLHRNSRCTSHQLTFQMNAIRIFCCYRKQFKTNFLFCLPLFHPSKSRHHFC